MSSQQLQKAPRSSLRIAARKTSASTAKGLKSKKGKTLPTTITSKNSKSSTRKGRGRGRDLVAPTEVAQPGSSALSTTAQVHQIPPSVSQPNTANPAMLVGYNNPQFEDSDSDEGDQLTPFIPPFFSKGPGFQTQTGMMQINITKYCLRGPSTIFAI